MTQLHAEFSSPLPTTEPGDAALTHGRMFGPAMRIAEDPVTGNAGTGPNRPLLTRILPLSVVLRRRR